MGFSFHIACTFAYGFGLFADGFSNKLKPIVGSVRFTCSCTFVTALLELHLLLWLCLLLLIIASPTPSPHDWGWPPGGLRALSLGGGGSSLEARWGALDAAVRGSRGWEGAPLRLGARWDALGRAEMHAGKAWRHGANQPPLTDPHRCHRNH